VRQSLAAWIENAISIDYLVLWVRQKEKVNWFCAVLGNGIDHFLQVCLRFISYHKNLGVRQGGVLQKRFQLSELLDAVGSPVSTVENEYDIFSAPEA
jgi:hypothetical protein